MLVHGSACPDRVTRGARDRLWRAARGDVVGLHGPWGPRGIRLPERHAQRDLPRESDHRAVDSAAPDPPASAIPRRPPRALVGLDSIGLAYRLTVLGVPHL